MFIIDKELLKSTFKVDTFKGLERGIETMPPSMVMYHLEQIMNTGELVAFNKNNARYTISNPEFNLIIGYDNEVYLEIFRDEEDTASFF